MAEVKTDIKAAVQYSGSVKVTILKNKKPIKTTTKHNKGFYPLFRAIADSLMGKDARQKMPKYVDALQGDRNVPLRVRSRIVSPHIVEDAEQPSQDESSVAFVANIPFSSVLDPDEYITKLRLYNSYESSGIIGEDPSLLAEVELGDSKFKLESSGYSAMIVWTIVVTNGIDNTSGNLNESPDENLEENEDN